MTKLVTLKAQLLLLLNISVFIFTCSVASTSSANNDSHLQISDLSALQVYSSMEHEIQLSIAGRDYSVKLLPSHTSDQIKNIEAKHYKGHVVGDSESWVRLSYLDNEITGYIKAYGELLEIDTLGSHANAKQIARKVDSSNLEERTSGMDRVLIPPPRISSDPNPLPSSILTNRELTSTSRAVTRIMRLSIVIDSRFDEYYNGQGLEKAISTINAVDGLYQEQFGLAIQLNSAVLLRKTNDPFLEFDGNIEQLLRAFRDYSLDNKDFSEDQTAVHLFSGSSDLDNIIGLSWINTACRSDGYNASVSTPFSEQMLLAAHELAHNLGAVHDDAQSCVIEYNQVMWPNISSATASRFSNCSKAAVIPNLKASCNLDNIDIGISLELKRNGAFARQTEILAVTAHNAHSYRDAPDIHSATLIQNGMITSNLPDQCFRLADSIYCDHGTVPASDKNTVEFDISYSKTDTQIVKSEIDAPEINDISDTNNITALDLNSPNKTSGDDDSDPNSPSTDASSGGSAGSVGLLITIFMLLVGFTRRYHSNEQPYNVTLTPKRDRI